MQRFVGLGNFQSCSSARRSGWSSSSPVFSRSRLWFQALIGFIVAHSFTTFRQKVAQVARDAGWCRGYSAAMSTLAWLWLFDPSYSAFNYTLSFFGVGPIAWTGDADWARFSVILVNVWFGAPFFMIMYLASLKSVPRQLYEARGIDGANWWAAHCMSRYR